LQKRGLPESTPGGLFLQANARFATLSVPFSSALCAESGFRGALYARVSRMGFQSASPQTFSNIKIVFLSAVGTLRSKRRTEANLWMNPHSQTKKELAALIALRGDKIDTLDIPELPPAA
jgi:hypothetical protein